MAIKTHGETKTKNKPATKEYKTWESIKQRCNNKNYKRKYELYIPHTCTSTLTSN